MDSTQSIQIKDLSHTVAGKELFRELEFTIRRDSRIGLVGINGAGKSTLLKILSGELKADSGEIIFPRDLKVGYMPQFPPEHILTLNPHDSLRTIVGDAVEDYEIDEVLFELGFEWETIYEKHINELSGGWQKLVLFGMAIIGRPNLLLMDEPNNYMDNETLSVLEKYLDQRLRTPYIVVSHDRDFLDSNTNQTFFLRDQSIYTFNMPYTQSREALIHQDIAAMEARKAEDKEIERLRRSAKRLSNWAGGNSLAAANAYKSMTKRIRRKVGSKTDVSTERSAGIRLSTEQLTANTLIRIENMNVQTPNGDQLFSTDNVEILPNDRIVVLGRNGVGKSTFLRSLYSGFKEFQEGTQDGRFGFNPRLNIGYFDQSLENLDPQLSVIDTLYKLSTSSKQDCIQKLVLAGFRYQEQNKKVRDLSGGEKARLQLVLLQYMSSSLLILDEPTAHLDVTGIETLESELVDSDSTCIFISHDRRFIYNVANRFFQIIHGKLVEVDSPDNFFSQEP